MYICIDFDGTIVEHKYPEIGFPVPIALETIKELQEKHNIILLTMRGEKELKEAVKYLLDNGVLLFGVNENPTQRAWTKSKKVHGHIYIDDAAIGCPLTLDSHGKHCVDWKRIRTCLTELGVL